MKIIPGLIFAASLVSVAFGHNWLWLGDVQSSSVRLSASAADFGNCDVSVAVRNVEQAQWKTYNATNVSKRMISSPWKILLGDLEPLMHVSTKHSTRRLFPDMSAL